MSVRSLSPTRYHRSVPATEGGEKEQTFHLVYFHQHLVKTAFRPQVSTFDICLARDTYSNPAEYYPLTPYDLTEQVSEKYKQQIEQKLRTFHDFLHITHKTIDHTQCLCSGYPSLVLC
jgi:hypothetical protein